MILMITIAIIGFLLFIIIYFINGVYPYDVKFEIGITGLNLAFKTKRKAPPKKGKDLDSQILPI